ncbi:ferrous iron transport protein B [Humisphaera borealis]|uniref:Ferrous iron transport protein B n=1 Tax=Humisphaera borealis TaxID=2807512 RepID=A0A7M2WUD2_9BACT|nr:ferrous iron transport protein B [Humisphaera borealis]QOV89135.1 ferrous iron transport protein B [Humisphaera borealis]
MTSSPLEYTPLPVSPDKPLVVALAGNPNSGKTTIFNALTGLRQKVANYPGVTVEKKTGRCKLGDARWLDVIDLPGTYSLISRSPDEQVAMEVLRGLRNDTPAPDVVIVVVDASNLQRNLYLVSQLIELGRPMVVALNMTDVAERRGIFVNAEALSKEIGVPVIPVVGHKRKGIEELKAAVARAAIAPLPAWPVKDAMREELLLLAGGLAVAEGEAAGSPADKPINPQRYEAIAERLLIGDHAPDVAPLLARPSVDALLKGSFERLKVRGIDPMQADIEAHYQWIDGLSSRVTRASGAFVRTDGAFADAREGLTGDKSADKTLQYATPTSNTTEKVDAILVHKIWGLLIFASIMSALFVSIFWLAEPIMGWVEGLITGTGEKLTGSMEDGALKSLISDGIFKGVGGVVVFVPQIAMLFLFLAILEDSGYLARAAFLMDKLLGKVGLSGKAFIPLLSSFACAIPGIMATRTIENRRDRLATIFVAPFMSCSARLPVYTLLIGTFFAGYGALAQGGIMLACYVLGVVAAVITAFFFKRTFLKGPAQAFILELPSYKIPQISQVIRVVWSNTAKFLTRAGTIIFCLTIILWAMGYYPRLPEDKGATIRDQLLPNAQQRASRAFVEERLANLPANTVVEVRLNGTTVTFDHEAYRWFESRRQQSGPRISPINLTIDGRAIADEVFAARSQAILDEDDEVARAVAAAQSEYSISGRIGHFMEPAIKPLGYDWKMGVGLVAAFAAREVFVSSLGVVYSVGEVEDDDRPLREHILADTYPDGTKVWTPLVAVSLLVWFVLAMQCMSTLAIVRRETGTWRWPLGMMLYMNVLAYVVCLIVYQVGSRLMGT